MKPKRFASRTTGRVSPPRERSDANTSPAANDASVKSMGFPAGVRRHERYLSPWIENKVVFNIANHKSTTEKQRTIDLDEISIAAGTTYGGIYNGTVQLSEFPHFQVALKYVINGVLTDFHEGEAGTKVGTVVRLCLHIFSWLIQRAIYRLEDATHDDIKEMLAELARRPWSKINSANRRLIKLGLEIISNPHLAQKYAGKSKGGPTRASVFEIERAIGLPLSNYGIPNWFRRRLGQILDPKRDVFLTKHAPQVASYGEVNETAHALNRLSLAPEGVDCFQFRPFQSPHSAAGSLISEERGQTPNLTPKECVALMRVFFLWLYDYGPKLIAILREVRNAIESQQKFAGNASINDLIATRYNAYIESGELKGERIHATRDGSDEFIRALATLMASNGSLVGMNHARRANEIFGKDKPYGAYFGCVEKISDMPLAFEAEFYVEKGPKEYRLFPANVIVADAIKQMEEIYVLFRPIGEPVPDYASPRSDGRSRKLYQVRRMNKIGFRDTSFTPDWRPAFKVLAESAGVDYSRWVKQHAPYRRMYATWFMRRYDMRELPALQQQLGQAHAGQAYSYGSDKGARPPGQSVNELHPRDVSVDEAAVFKELAIANRDYLVDLVMALFNLERSGGMFPRLVIKLAKRLSAAADFRKLSAARKAGVVVDKLIPRGYSITPMRHTICVAGTAKGTRRFANCAQDGALRRELATPGVCSGCIHSWTNDAYHANLLEEAERCRTRAKKPEAPASYAVGQMKQAEALAELIRLDQAIAADTQTVVGEFLVQWNQAMGEE